jgi:hypothetical protein
LNFVLLPRISAPNHQNHWLSADGPKFKVGDKEILFLQNDGSQFAPLVAIMNGRFHVRMNESGQQIVPNNVDEPVKTLRISAK